MRRLLSPPMLFAAGVVIFAVLATALLGLILDSRRSCQSEVRTRDGQRTMWLYLLETNPNPDDPRAVAFRDELDLRIPALECRGLINIDAVPVEDS